MDTLLGGAEKHCDRGGGAETLCSPAMAGMGTARHGRCSLLLASVWPETTSPLKKRRVIKGLKSFIGLVSSTTAVWDAGRRLVG